jgi:hypothetical protein
MHRLQKFGIKPDGIINFLSNEPPIGKLLYVPDTAQLCCAEAHRLKKAADTLALFGGFW